MDVIEICTLIGTIVSILLIVYKLGRLSSKVDSNTHRLDRHDDILDNLK